MLRIKIHNQLIIPFGCPKWEISKIRLAGVSTKSTYLVSDTPCAYIDLSLKSALRLKHIRYAFPEELPIIKDGSEAIKFIGEYMKEKCQLDTESEKRFLDMYFYLCVDLMYGRIVGARDSGSELEFNYIFDALLPLPQAHFYLDNPLDIEFFSPSAAVPKKMFKVDFAFWTGERFVAVEIDGSSHIGSEAHIHKDRILRRAGIDVVHILNSELTKHKDPLFMLLPRDVTHSMHKNKDDEALNPLAMLPSIAEAFQDILTRPASDNSGPQA